MCRKGTAHPGRLGTAVLSHLPWALPRIPRSLTLGFTQNPSVTYPGLYPESLAHLPWALPRIPQSLTLGFTQNPSLTYPGLYPESITHLPRALPRIPHSLTLGFTLGFTQNPSLTYPGLYPESITHLPRALPRIPHSLTLGFTQNHSLTCGFYSYAMCLLFTSQGSVGAVHHKLVHTNQKSAPSTGKTALVSHW